MLTNPAGFVANKTEYLDGVKADSATYESVSNSDQVVSIYDNAAVVTGSTVVKGRFDGHDIGGGISLAERFAPRSPPWLNGAHGLPPSPAGKKSLPPTPPKTR